ncbi:MAG: hypothetical protein QOF33_2749 [Thermomicrobiales bacterium]|jgi:hypothetical protein|nr:hypothetical protein [Thermomicrobiales bacterium]MEA2526277.1 hypothetical protein [Thermomicrobiales bacterium]MEA2584664.1 hypothetical protein [Thermomicrobiales bacterium]
MNLRIKRLAWTAALLFGVVVGGLGAMAPGAEARTNPKGKSVFDVGITGVCRQLRAPIGVLVTVTNLGTKPAAGITVSGGTVFGGGEYVESYDKALPVSSLQPGESAIVRFTGQEIRDQGGTGYLYFFSVSSAQVANDANPDNDNLSFHSFTQIRPCPLNVTPTLDSK